MRDPGRPQVSLSNAAVTAALSGGHGPAAPPPSGQGTLTVQLELAADLPLSGQPPVLRTTV
ncbi:hypothetical protein ACWEWX_52165, partial [Streptomyces asiaticus]